MHSSEGCASGIPLVITAIQCWCCTVDTAVLKVAHDIEDYSNALNKLQEQLDKISGAASEEQVIINCSTISFW